MSRKKRKLSPWLKGGIVLLLAGSLLYGAMLGLMLRGCHDQILNEPEVMVILGCKVEPWGPSVLLRDRLEEGLTYLEGHPDMKVLVSGGQGPDEPVSEARAMADYLTERGVPPDSVILEDRSHNTTQNFKYSRMLLEEMGYDGEEEVLVVSNGFHLTRARMLARRAGFSQVSTLAAPSSHLPSRIKMYIREPMALVKSFLLDR